MIKRVLSTAARARTPGVRLLAPMLALTSCLVAQAETQLGEVSFFLTADEFRPGWPASATFLFGTRPEVQLSHFELTMSWDTDLAAPKPSGAGSVAAWVEQLGAKGVASFHYANPRLIHINWTAASSLPADLISTDYSAPLQGTFSFQTSPLQQSSFNIRIELSNLRDGAADSIDIGSGLTASSALSPVPEPPIWWAMASGCVLTAFRTRRSRPPRK